MRTRHISDGPVTEPSAVVSDVRRSDPRRLRRLLIASDVFAIVVGIAAAIGIQQVVNPVPSKRSCATKCCSVC